MESKADVIKEENRDQIENETFIHETELKEEINKEEVQKEEFKEDEMKEVTESFV